jgi:hypothetical protein
VERPDEEEVKEVEEEGAHIVALVDADTLQGALETSVRTASAVKLTLSDIGCVITVAVVEAAATRVGDGAAALSASSETTMVSTIMSGGTPTARNAPAACCTWCCGCSGHACTANTGC